MPEGTASPKEEQAEAWAHGRQCFRPARSSRLPQSPRSPCPSPPPSHAPLPTPLPQNNKLEKIPPGAFSELSNLRELYLQNNYLTDEGLDNETFW